MRNSDRACETLIFRYRLYETFIGHLPKKVKKDDRTCEYLIILARWWEFISGMVILFENLILCQQQDAFEGLMGALNYPQQLNDK
jgi:hypothetical protein